MSSPRKRSTAVLRTSAAAVLVLAGLYACSVSHERATSPLRSDHTTANWVGDGGYVNVCKASGPAGTYSFHIDVSGGGDYHFESGGGPDLTLTFDGTNLVCHNTYFVTLNDTWGVDTHANVTVTEILPGGQTANEIQVYIPEVFPSYQYSVFGANSITLSIGALDRRNVYYLNPNTPPPVVVNCTEVHATQGVAITPVQLNASGGDGGPYTFTATGLPAGLTLSSSGLLSGTPTVTGTYSYSVTATDVHGHSGTSANCAVTVGPPQETSCPAGSFSYSFLANGDLFIIYKQFPAPNDNSYGVNAVGWLHGHRFSDLVNSDHAGFQLTDGGGTARLSFNIDYLTAVSTAPSGYASLGVNGGDGKMLIGTGDGISANTSLAMNLNGQNIPGLFNASHVQQFGSVNVLVDSPPTDAAHQTYVISDPTLTNWDFADSYYVTISAAKLASIGFNAGTWHVQPNADQLHNSPPKACPASQAGALSITKYEVKDKQVKVTIFNNSSSDVQLNALTLDWPSGTNGKLMQVKLDGDLVYGSPAIAGGTASLTSAQLTTDLPKRKIGRGSSDVYTLIFEKNADTDLAHYAGTATFGTTTLTVLPP